MIIKYLNGRLTANHCLSITACVVLWILCCVSIEACPVDQQENCTSRCNLTCSSKDCGETGECKPDCLKEPSGSDCENVTAEPKEKDIATTNELKEADIVNTNELQEKDTGTTNELTQEDNAATNELKHEDIAATNKLNQKDIAATNELNQKDTSTIKELREKDFAVTTELKKIDAATTVQPRERETTTTASENISKCDDGFYGINCTLVCPKNCVAEMCDRVTGDCRNGCIDGYSGNQCGEVCAKGFYGSGCRNECPSNCATNDCHHASGYCLQGCKAEYWGSDCSLIGEFKDNQVETQNKFYSQLSAESRSVLLYVLMGRYEETLRKAQIEVQEGIRQRNELLALMGADV